MEPLSLLALRIRSFQNLLRVSALLGREPRRLDQVGTPAAGALDGILTAPGVNLGMIAAHEHRRHALAVELGGASLLRVLEQATVLGSRERLIDVTHLVTKGAGNQTHDGVGNDHSGKLAARKHVVADR